MEETTARRLAAFNAARDLMILQGVGCPACIAGLAEHIDTFLQTGDTSQFEHFTPSDEGDPSDDDPTPEGKVLKFDPKKVN